MGNRNTCGCEIGCLNDKKDKTTKSIPTYAPVMISPIENETYDSELNKICSIKDKFKRSEVTEKTVFKDHKRSLMLSDHQSAKQPMHFET
mgnify:CR=1 FL=1